MTAWKHIKTNLDKVCRLDIPLIDMNFFLAPEAIGILNKIQKIASISDHEFIQVLKKSSHLLDLKPYNMVQLQSQFFSNKTNSRISDGQFLMLMSLVRLNSLNIDKNYNSCLSKVQMMAQIYETTNLAITLQSTIKNDDPIKNAGNKIALLLSDVLFAKVSKLLSKYNMPFVVENISEAISSTLEGRYSNLKPHNPPVLSLSIIDKISAKSGSNCDPVKVWLSNITSCKGILFNKCLETVIKVLDEEAHTSLESIESYTNLSHIWIYLVSLENFKAEFDHLPLTLFNEASSAIQDLKNNTLKASYELEILDNVFEKISNDVANNKN